VQDQKNEVTFVRPRCPARSSRLRQFAHARCRDDPGASIRPSNNGTGRCSSRCSKSPTSRWRWTCARMERSC
jgi:hypothetical protein